MNIPYVMKRCSKCGRWLVASTVNFHRAKKGRYGLASQCKECWSKKNKQWIETNRDKVTEYKKQWREANPEYYKQYYKNNRKKVLEHKKQWREANPEYHKQYYENNRDKLLKYHEQWYQTPQGQVVEFNRHQRRRTKEEQQGTGITKDQWLEMMNYFEWKCAYSGETLSKDTRSVDHIVPLNSGGDHEIWNMVPMLRKLNSSKNASNMEEWYKEQDCYDPKRLQKIYEWQEFAYNKWGKDAEYFNTNDIQIKLL